MHDACQLRVVRGTARISLARKVPHGIHAREFGTAVFVDGRRNYVESVTTKGREPRLIISRTTGNRSERLNEGDTMQHFIVALVSGKKGTPG
jgi:hypothetical protein